MKSKKKSPAVLIDDPTIKLFSVTIGNGKLTITPVGPAAPFFIPRNWDSLVQAEENSILRKFAKLLDTTTADLMTLSDQDFGYAIRLAVGAEVQKRLCKAA